MNNEAINEFKKFERKFELIWGIMEDSDYVSNLTLLCALADAVASQEGRKGYEMIEEVLPIMHKVGDQFGVFEYDR